MNAWMIGKKVNETLLPNKEDFYGHLNLTGITNSDYMDTKRVNTINCIFKQIHYC